MTPRLRQSEPRAVGSGAAEQIGTAEHLGPKARRFHVEAITPFEVVGIRGNGNILLLTSSWRSCLLYFILHFLLRAFQNSSAEFWLLRDNSTKAGNWQSNEFRWPLCYFISSLVIFHCLLFSVDFPFPIVFHVQCTASILTHGIHLAVKGWSVRWTPPSEMQAVSTSLRMFCMDTLWVL